MMHFEWSGESTPGGPTTALLARPETLYDRKQGWPRGGTRHLENAQTSEDTAPASF